jgi:hypothetical protein
MRSIINNFWLFILLLFLLAGVTVYSQGLGSNTLGPGGNGNGKGNGLVNNPNHPGVPEPSAVITCVITLGVISWHIYRRRNK